MTIHSDWQIQTEDRMHRKGDPPPIIVDMTSDEEIRKRLAEKRAIADRQHPKPEPSGVNYDF